MVQAGYNKELVLSRTLAKSTSISYTHTHRFPTVLVNSAHLETSQNPGAEMLRQERNQVQDERKNETKGRGALWEV